MRISPLRTHFDAHPVDWNHWQKLYKKHQKEYLRSRLRMVKLFAQGHDIEKTARLIGVAPNTVRKHLRAYQKGGLEALVKPKGHTRACRLSPAQQQTFREVVLESTPQQKGLQGHIWTGKTMCDWIKKAFGIEMKSGIYDMLRRLGLSHQRAHSDYLDPDPQAQYEFGQNLEAQYQQVAQAPDEAILAGDEFYCSNQPTCYYGWAEKNSRPKVPTQNKNIARLNGVLAVDLHRGTTFFEALENARSTDIAQYLAAIACDYAEWGYRKLHIWLDNYRGHKQQMRTELEQILSEVSLDIEVEVCDFPAYSPYLNPVEYLIHKVRQQFLHHAPAKRDINAIAQELMEHIDRKVWSSAEEMQNLLRHIQEIIEQEYARYTFNSSP
jgi:transposase